MAATLFRDEVPAGHAERYDALMSPESPRAVVEATRWTVELDVSTVTAPSPLFGAERDLLVPAASVRGLATALGSDVEILPHQGHGLMLNPVWAVVTARTEDWLRQREGAG